MQPEQKVQLGVAEAEALAAWLERVAKALDGAYIDAPERWLSNIVKDAREWARVVKPVPIKRRGMP